MKWLAITFIAILVIGLAGVGYLFLQETNKLKGAESEIVTLEGNVSSLEGTVSTLEGSVSTLETDLADSQVTASTLETNLGTANISLKAANSKVSKLQADVSTQRTLNSALSEELKTVKDPRHFQSLTELVDWFDEDDTDTQYADESSVKKAFILQVRALRDGYLLAALILADGGAAVIAVIEDEYWAINPEDDDTQKLGNIDPIPSHPLPLD